MGYIRHHAIVVTGTDWGETTIYEAHYRAEEIFGGELVSDVVSAEMNGYFSFFVAPDGSKEGWSTSNGYDSLRDHFIGWLEEQRYGDRSSPLDWVEVQFGDGEWETKIVRDSDELLREEGLKVD